MPPLGFTKASESEVQTHTFLGDHHTKTTQTHKCNPIKTYSKDEHGLGLTVAGYICEKGEIPNCRHRIKILKAVVQLKAKSLLLCEIARQFTSICWVHQYSKLQSAFS